MGCEGESVVRIVRPGRSRLPGDRPDRGSIPAHVLRFFRLAGGKRVTYLWQPLYGSHQSGRVRRAAGIRRDDEGG